MKKFAKIFDIIFIVVALLSLIEFSFVRGMFTWIISVGALTILGAIEAIWLVCRKEYHKSVLTSLLCLAILSGYIAFL